MNQQATISRAIIIGAGIGGLCTAIALQRMGVSVEIYEQAPQARAAGAGLTLWPNAMRAMRDLGVASRLDDHLIEVSGAIRRWDGVTLSQTDYAQIKDRYDAPTIAIHRVDLMHALLDALNTPVIFGKRLTRYEQDATHITAIFDDDTRAEADLLVGADGIHSVVRSQMLPRSKPRYSGYPAWRAVVNFDHARVDGMWGETWGRGARFGLVPISQGRVYWFATANRAANTPPADHRATLQALFGNWHSPIPDLIAATSDDELLYNDIMEIDPLSTWRDGRAVLLGDAAHAMTPNMGQGACQAIEDAAALARAMQTQADLPAALAAYESQRLPHTRRVLLQSRTIGRVGQMSQPLLVTVRDALMRRIPASATLRQLDFVLAPSAE